MVLVRNLQITVTELVSVQHEGNLKEKSYGIVVICIITREKNYFQGTFSGNVVKIA